MELKARTDCGRVSADGTETHYVTLTFVAPQAEARRERRPVNVGISLDRSGSMNGEKFELACTGVETSLRLLRAMDRFALVAFDHEIAMLAGAREATTEARSQALGDLRRLGARGNTNLSGGWLRAAEEIGAHAGDGATTRVLLLTDGQANQGITDEAELWGHAARLRERGVLTSTVGIGASFNERLLKGLSEQGGGNAYYVENAAQLPDVLAGEVGETLDLVLRDCLVEVSVPAGARAMLLEAFDSRPVDGGFAVRLGDVTSNQLVQLCFEVTLPAAEPGGTIALAFALKANREDAPVATTRTAWQYDTPEAAAAAPRDEETQAAVAGVLEARARQDAVEHNRAGRYDEARHAMAWMAEKLRRIGSKSERVQASVEQLDAEAELHAADMDPADLKRRYYAAQYRKLGRDAQGRSRKGEK